LASAVNETEDEDEGEDDRAGLRINRNMTIPLAEVTVRASRSSGPGGQHANVTASRIEASFDVLASSALSEAQRERVLARLGPRVVAISQDGRSQARNRELALARLRERLAGALLCPSAAAPPAPPQPRASAGCRPSAAPPNASASAGPQRTPELVVPAVCRYVCKQNPIPARLSPANAYRPSAAPPGNSVP
jgi:ribosome-associated protein